MPRSFLFLETNMISFKKFIVEGVAYHGSPHDFSQFDMSKLGTGEGNNAYGWGLYFTSSREVSEWYRTMLTRNEDYVTINGQPLKDVTNYDESTIKKLNRVLLDNALDVEKALRQLDRDKRILYITQKAKQEWTAMMEFLEHILTSGDQLGIENTNRTGSMYEVDLAPGDEEYLNWNDPLSAQSDDVLGKLMEFFNQIYPEGILAHTDKGLIRVPLDVVMSKPNSKFMSQTGEQIYERITKILGNEKKASLYLLSLGIPGITYFGKSELRNYVLFDTKFINLKRKE